jgi:RimJ/RimL family protein N-acetyltransferase
LELRLPTEDELVDLAAVAEAGVHPPEQMPFQVPWTDAIGSAGFVEGFVDYHVGLRRDWQPEDWHLNLAVWREGEPVGVQGVSAERFSSERRVVTGSWLGERHQGVGYGTEMRTAVLELAFSGLGAAVAVSGAIEGNRQSARVSEKLAYELAGEDWIAPRGTLVRQLRYELPVERWLTRTRSPVEIAGLPPCLPLFGVSD